MGRVVLRTYDRSTISSQLHSLKDQPVVFFPFQEKASTDFFIEWNIYLSATNKKKARSTKGERASNSLLRFEIKTYA